MSEAERMKWRAVLAGVLCLAPALGWAQGMMGSGNGSVMTNGSARHAYFMRQGVPAPYAKMANPLKASAVDLNAGKQLYADNCIACHGAGGRGDGVVGSTLDPRPADLAAIVRMPMASDGYLYWSIAEGGASFGTAMPAAKNTLQPEEIWKIILYIRSF
jgi:mono/diheme cytochrome c family protein